MVKEEVPLLIPVRLLRDLRCVIDFSTERVEFKKHGHQTFMNILPSGHAAISITEFEAGGWRLPVEAIAKGMKPEDFTYGHCAAMQFASFVSENNPNSINRSIPSYHVGAAAKIGADGREGDWKPKDVMEGAMIMDATSTVTSISCAFQEGGGDGAADEKWNPLHGELSGALSDMEDWPRLCCRRWWTKLDQPHEMNGSHACTRWSVKSRMFNRSGLSPTQRQIGLNVRICGSLCSDDVYEATLLRSTATQGMQRMFEIREAAMEGFLRHSSQEVIRKAQKARPRVAREFYIGETVFVTVSHCRLMVTNGLEAQSQGGARRREDRGSGDAPSDEIRGAQ